MENVAKILKAQIFFKAITNKVQTDISNLSLEHTSAFFGLTESIEENKPVVVGTNLNFDEGFIREMEIDHFIERTKEDDGHEVYAYMYYDVFENEDKKDVVAFYYVFNDKKRKKSYYIENNEMKVDANGDFVEGISFKLIED
jgi:hypothetical protein